MLDAINADKMRRIEDELRVEEATAEHLINIDKTALNTDGDNNLTTTRRINKCLLQENSIQHRIVFSHDDFDSRHWFRSYGLKEKKTFKY